MFRGCNYQWLHCSSAGYSHKETENTKSGCSFDEGALKLDSKPLLNLQRLCNVSVRLNVSVGQQL